MIFNPSSKENNIGAGLACAVFAYLIWGIQAAYWKLLSETDPFEVIAHRYIWSLVFLLIVVLVTKQCHKLRSTVRLLVSNPALLFTFISATIIAMVNWGINIVAPMTGHVVELGLGLFLTPLMSMGLGVVLFREKLSLLKKTSIFLATIGFLIMAFRFGSFPWIAFSVSFTWAVYGALKKKIYLDPTMGVLLESVISLPITLGYLIWLQLSGNSHFSVMVPDQISLALFCSGIITSVPLIAFMYAANKLPLTLLGFCQYISPVLTLILGIFVYDENFGANELFTMSFIWAAIALFFVSEIHSRKTIWHIGKCALVKHAASTGFSRS